MSSRVGSIYPDECTCFGSKLPGTLTQLDARRRGEKGLTSSCDTDARREPQSRGGGERAYLVTPNLSYDQEGEKGRGEKNMEDADTWEGNKKKITCLSAARRVVGSAHTVSILFLVPFGKIIDHQVAFYRSYVWKCEDRSDINIDI